MRSTGFGRVSRASRRSGRAVQRRPRGFFAIRSQPRKRVAGQDGRCSLCSAFHNGQCEYAPRAWAQARVRHHADRFQAGLHDHDRPHPIRSNPVRLPQTSSSVTRLPPGTRSGGNPRSPFHCSCSSPRRRRRRSTTAFRTGSENRRPSPILLRIQGFGAPASHSAGRGTSTEWRGDALDRTARAIAAVLLAALSAY